MPHDLLFYDGGCGLCHRWVRLLLRRDADGSRFRFAPLGGPTFQASFGREGAIELPDSVVLRSADGRTLLRSGAALHAAARLGGAWAALAAAARLLPPALLDRAYDAVASRRRRWVAPPAAPCPMPGPEFRDRFLP